MPFRIEKRLPTVEEYNNLKRLVAWPVLEPSLTKKGIDHSLFSVCIMSDDVFIGMGRIVGDGAIYFHIQDVVVHPGFQRKGIGKMIMEELMKYLDQAAAKNANIGLMCSKGREKFYADFGFTARPNERHGAGMTKVAD